MFEWTATDAGIRVVGGEQQVLVEAPDWRPTGEGPDLHRPVDAALSGSTTRLRVPATDATVLGVGRVPARCRPLASNVTCDLPARDHLLTIDGRLDATLRFSGPATVRRDDGTVAVAFADRTAVTIGFRDATPETIPVPPTAAGVAAAVSVAGAALPHTPERSRPSARPAVPAFDVDSDHAVPETPAAPLTLTVPDDWGALFAVAPLAYYLGTRTVVDVDCQSPRLRAPGVGIDRAFDPPAEAASGLLRRVFWLDCLVRGHDTAPAATDLLDDLSLDARTCRRLDAAERLARYLDAPFERVADALPEWHLSMYVAPTPDNAGVLPALLDRLAAIYPPETEPLTGRELMERSLDDFYRGHIPSVDVVKPTLRDGRLHGWLAPETPIDVFNALPEAFANRRRYRDRDGPVTVVVILNDPAMAGEHDDAAAAYRKRAAEIPLDVTVRRDLSRAELDDVFTAETDLLHFIGHCETDGLQCPDGALSASSLPECNAQTFVLNACGSYHEGRELVRKGSVAGAVTYREVLDEQAATVGTTVARLLVEGFCIERAVRLARRQIMMGKDYAVVGDGTHSLVQASGTPLLGRVRETPDGYRLTCRAPAVEAAGGVFDAPLPGRDRPTLTGGAAAATLDRDALRSTLANADFPVVFEGSVYWANALAERLASE